MRTISYWQRPFEIVFIYQPPNAQVQISGIFAKQRNGGGGREKDL
jgi:hypothetical protein